MPSENCPRLSSPILAKVLLPCARIIRRFRVIFAEMAEPLFSLIRLDTPFVGSTYCDSAFLASKILSHLLQSLAYPDFRRPFILSTDASATAIEQASEKGLKHNVVFFSRTLNATTQWATKNVWRLSKLFVTSVIIWHLVTSWVTLTTMISSNTSGQVS